MLSKFNNSYLIQVKGVTKEVFKESWEHGQGDHIYCTDCSHLNFELFIKENTFSDIEVCKKLKDKILKEFEDKFRSSDFTLTTFEEHDYITAETYEDLHENIITFDKNTKEEVFSCQYLMKVSINGVELEYSDLNIIFNESKDKIKSSNSIADAIESEGLIILRCTDDVDSDGLITGNYYVAVDKSDTQYNTCGVWYDKSRFEVISII